MPRKAFVADLQDAKEQLVPDWVIDLKAGDDDGVLIFSYKSPGDRLPAVKIQAHVSDVGDYPTEHQYFIYTDSENVPPEITKVLSNIDAYMGLRISPMISNIVNLLEKVTAGSSHRHDCLDDDRMDIDASSPPADYSQEENEDEGNESDNEIGYDEQDGYSDDWDIPVPRVSTKQPQRQQEKDPKHMDRIRSDLRQVKKAGFHVGYLGSFDYGMTCHLVISIRASKLGIPEDALQAWHIDESEYVMLLLHYPDGYRPMHELLVTKSAIKMRVGLCNKQKISLSQAVDAFTNLERMAKKKSDLDARNQIITNSTEPPVTLDRVELGLRDLFIGQPLNQLLNERFLHVLQYRTGLKVPWTGAEAYYHDNQGLNNVEVIEDKYWEDEPSKLTSHLPKIVTADHLDSNPGNPSFPLIAMQFLLRHLVRCTEFCLVCHHRVDAEWEALMPYVCDRPLCLYQYMALGFGPSTEHAILTQPYVVDLLISFCYCAASHGSLKDFPTGMGLMVSYPTYMSGGPIFPVGSQYTPVPELPPPDTISSRDITKPKLLRASFDKFHNELVFPENQKPLKVGDWICILPSEKIKNRQHRKVLEVWYPKVHLGPAIYLESALFSESKETISTKPAGEARDKSGGAVPYAQLTPVSTPWTASPQVTNATKETPIEVEFSRYDQNFDDLSTSQKMSAIRHLLDTLPSVTEMKTYLQSMGNNASLRTWTDRLTPAAIGVLRWIIASNRSCIVQIDKQGEGKKGSEERVSGMQSYMQFKFAQGAPDKEQRFLESVRDAQQRLSLKNPTIFAWHGSILSNWHGIIREGLHFNKTVNGRAFGNGVYFSPYIMTSLGYSHPVNEFERFGWPKSLLKITSAICLNEIVNAPDEFVSRKPHLVVAQLDWIQTRYLFVKCAEPGLDLMEEKIPSQVLEQDPTIHPLGTKNEKIVIPVTAISKARRDTATTVKKGNKKSKVASPTQPDNNYLYVSDDTDSQDEKFLNEGNILSDDDDYKLGGVPVPMRTSGVSVVVNNAKKGRKRLLPSRKIGKSAAKQEPLTDFVPGSLDHSKLPKLQPPSYATPQATKAIQRELKATLAAQENNPLHELGWYLDSDLVENVYQWIVELHSFDPSLPLAQDMKARDIKSVVLELRFGKEFPYSPPFVRVIRPRFLPFMLGGGGHVTAGGAMCLELLTNDGWNPASSIEAVLLQVRMAITSTDPKPARLQNGIMGSSDYSVHEAVEAFRRACMAHGWKVPDDLQAMISQSSVEFLPGFRLVGSSTGRIM